MKKTIAERILVSLMVKDEALLRSQLSTLHGLVGWVELRLDQAPAQCDLRTLRADFPQLHFVAAILLVKEGGFFSGNHQQRIERLQHAATCGFDVVDLPLGSGYVALPESVRRLVSWHQPRSSVEGPLTQPIASLQGILQQAQQEAGAQGLVKLVSWADSAEQALPAVLLQQRANSSLLSFAQGPGSEGSRILSLLAGAPWIYSCWSGSQTAPGQLDFRTLLQLLPQSAGPQTKVLGIVGRSVEHSLSPFLWNRALRETDQDAVYLRFPVDCAHTFFRDALTCGITALSVTAPWKSAAAQASSTPIEGGVANFLHNVAGAWQAANTDGGGALNALEHAGLAVGSRLLILGAGGAAHGVALEAVKRGYELTVAARRLEQAQQLCVSCALDYPLQEAACVAQDLSDVNLKDFAAVIQATSVGSFLQPGSPTPAQTFSAASIALDMVYHPLQTPWLKQAKQDGACTVFGTAMLCRQMLEQFRMVTSLDMELARLQQGLEKEIQQRESVVLIGARASGKTTLGRALAQRLGWSFVDSDAELAQRHQRSLTEWILTDEQSFRAAECELLAELLTWPRHVVALGGGVVERSVSVARLQMATRVVFLHCPVSVLLERQQRQPRPRLSDLPLAEEIEYLLARRQAHYQKCADFMLASVGDPAEIVEQLFLSPVLKLFPT